MLSTNIHDLLTRLSAHRPVFHSEADFQHAFAWKLQEMWPDAHVRLEKPVESNSGERLHLDIWLERAGEFLAIELKYKTARLACQVDGEHFVLKSQAAQDLGRYDFVKDISRLERITRNRSNCSGWAILLTNVAQYWQTARSASAVDNAFRLHDGRLLNGILAWDTRAARGTIRGRERALELRGVYPLTWRAYSQTGTATNSDWRYLAVAVSSSL